MDSLSEIQKGLNEIWLHGTAEQKEETREMLLDLADALHLPPPEGAEEALTIEACVHLLDAMRPVWTGPQRMELIRFVHAQVTAIAAARHRDITLI